MLKKKVLIVDDSAYFRSFLKDRITKDERFTVIGEAENPYQAAKIISNEKPDVISLDIEMPRMDGLTFLRKIMSQHPIPVVLVTSINSGKVQKYIEALKIGAIDIISKQDVATKGNEADFFTEVLYNASNSKMQRYTNQGISNTIQPKKALHTKAEKKQVVLIGASAGGTIILTQILSKIKDNLPPIVVVQHMPKDFIPLFAKNLDEKCTIPVLESSNNQNICAGNIYLAAGGLHTEIKQSHTGLQLTTHDTEPYMHVKPAVDKLFLSACNLKNIDIHAILLTGMGKDGALGMYELKQKGAHTIAQDEATSIIFGMPRAAIELNAQKQIMSVSEITNYINKLKL